MSDKAWYVYILKCSDGSLYTGIALDVTRRLSEHNDGIGCKYTRTRRPVTLVYDETHSDYKSAWKREREIKRWPRKKKLALILETRNWEIPSATPDRLRE
jgi:putative endonuclease